MIYHWVFRNRHWNIYQVKTNLVKVKRPVCEKFKISSPFGKTRTLTINGETVTRVHNGVDFSCPEETEVKAILPGQIHEVGYENPDNEKQGYGFRIIQRCQTEDGVFWVYYGHLKWALVHNGYMVKAGEPIAMSGNTGSSTGPHLHVSIRENNTGNYFDMEYI